MIRSIGQNIISIQKRGYLKISDNDGENSGEQKEVTPQFSGSLLFQKLAAKINIPIK